MDFDLATPVTEAITLEASDMLTSDFVDATSFTRVQGKGDIAFQRDDWGVGHSQVTSWMAGAMRGFWKFNVTKEIVDAYIALGYKNLTFNAYVRGLGGSCNGNLYFFGDSVVIPITPATSTEISLDIVAFRDWVAAGQTTSFIANTYVTGQGQMYVNSFALKKDA